MGVDVDMPPYFTCWICSNDDDPDRSRGEDLDRDRPHRHAQGLALLVQEGLARDPLAGDNLVFRGRTGYLPTFSIRFTSRHNRASVTSAFRSGAVRRAFRPPQAAEATHPSIICRAFHERRSSGCSTPIIALARLRAPPRSASIVSQIWQDSWPH